MKEDYSFTEYNDKITEERKQKIIKSVKDIIYKGGIAQYQIFRIGKNQNEYNFIYDWLEENDIKIRGREGVITYEKQGYAMSNTNIVSPDQMDSEEQEKLFLKLQSFSQKDKENYIEKYKKVREELIMHNMKLAKWLVGTKEIREIDTSLEDKIQMAYMGLIEAVDNYDPNRGIKFSTYAIKSIYRTIIRECIRETGNFKNNNEVNEQFSKLLELEEQIFNKNGRSANKNEIADLLGVSLKRAEELRTLLGICQKESIEELNSSKREEEVIIGNISDEDRVDLGSEGETILAGAYLDEDEILPVGFTQKDIVGDEVMVRMLKEDIEKALSSLSERERTILILRFGLNNSEPKTFVEIGEEYNLSKTRIQAIMSAGIKKIRESKHRNLKNYLDVAQKEQSSNFIER